MSELTVSFAFEIGDIVYFKQAAHDERGIPIAHMILERIAQECHGGAQRLYKLCAFADTVPEIALSAERPPMQSRTPDQIEAIRQNQLSAERAREEVWRVLREEKKDAKATDQATAE